MGLNPLSGERSFRTKSLHVFGRRVYVAGPEVGVFEIGEDGVPVPVGRIEYPAAMVSGSGHYLVLADRDSIAVFDTSTGAVVAKASVGGLKAVDLDWPNLAVLTTTSLEVYDLSAGNPRLVGAFAVGGANDVLISGRTVAAAIPHDKIHLHDGGVLIHYLDNPDPQVVISPGRTRNLARGPDGLILADDDSSVLDVIDPGEVQSVPTATPTFTSTPTEIPPTATETPTQEPPTSTPTPLAPTETPTAAPTATPTSSFLSVSGTVRRRDGRPLAGVQVVAFGPYTVLTVTDSEGRYTLTEMRPGEWTVVAALTDPDPTVFSVGDPIRALRLSVGLGVADGLDKIFCDANGDGRLSAVDAALLLAYLAERRDDLPAWEHCRMP